MYACACEYVHARVCMEVRYEYTHIWRGRTLSTISLFRARYPAWFKRQTKLSNKLWQTQAKTGHLQLQSGLFLLEFSIICYTFCCSFWTACIVKLAKPQNVQLSLAQFNFLVKPTRKAGMHCCAFWINLQVIVCGWPVSVVVVYSTTCVRLFQRRKSLAQVVNNSLDSLWEMATKSGNFFLYSILELLVLEKY